MHHPHIGTQWRMLQCLWLAGLVTVSARAQEPIPMGTLSGHIFGPDGNPVSGARVWTETVDAKTSSRKVFAEARTDALGRFRLGPVEAMYRPFRFGLHVESEGFAGQCIPSESLSIFPSLDCDIGTIRLDRGPRLHRQGRRRGRHTAAGRGCDRTVLLAKPRAHHGRGRERHERENRRARTFPDASPACGSPHPVCARP